MDTIKIYNKRQKLYNDLKDSTGSKIKIINGKYKDKIGEVLKIDSTRNNTYNNGKNKYHNYFSLTILIDNKNVITSCRNVKLLK